MAYQPNAYKVTMIFPKKYPDGYLIPASVWNAMANELRELEANFTEIPILGEWRAEKDDNSMLYFITVTTLERVEQLREFARRWRRPLRQQKMYFDYHPVNFEELD
jgi:hypothetical protein